MSRIEVNNYPVSQLPEDLRKNFEEGKHVKITIEDEHSDEEIQKELEELKVMLENYQRNNKNPTSIEEAVKMVRQLRDEWED
jgi:hypothetical protein